MPKEVQPTLEQTIEAKVKELKAQYNCEIGVLQFVDPETKEDVIGYYKMPDRTAKLTLADRIFAGAAMSSAGLVFDACYIPEASDNRIMSNDTFYMGAVNDIRSLVLTATNFYKKK